jgi:uncharacterized membrane protein
MSDPLFVLAMLCTAAAVSEWLGSRGFGRKIGGILIVIALAAVLANTGVIPSASNAPPLYGQLLAVAAPVSIFLLLLDVHLASLKQAGAKMLSAFLIGSAGTLLGVLAAFWLTDAQAWLGQFAAPIGGMYVATYIGGSANFNAVAMNYGVVNEATLFAGANAVDNVATAVWLALLLILPRMVHLMLGTQQTSTAEVPEPEMASTARPLTLGSLTTLLALAFGVYWLSLAVSNWSVAALGWKIPAILILTTLALLLAQLPAVQRLGGANLIGTYGAYLFLAVIGAYCDLGELAKLGKLGALLMLFVTLAVLIHGIIVFAAGMLLRLPPEMMAIASCANIGGPTTVMPTARSLGRMDLLLPGILVGSLGNAIGTYAGFLAVWLLSGSS